MSEQNLSRLASLVLAGRNRRRRDFAFCDSVENAILRDMRKKRFGSHKVEREYAGEGLFYYRLLVNRGTK